MKVLVKMMEMAHDDEGHCNLFKIIEPTEMSLHRVRVSTPEGETVEQTDVLLFAVYEISDIKELDLISANANEGRMCLHGTTNDPCTFLLRNDDNFATLVELE